MSYYNGSSYTFTWTAGRRLATAVKGSYSLSFTYNENGIRTSKTINAVKHEYILDGTNIIAEKWGASGVTHYMEYIYDANGDLTGFNMYAYCSGDPINEIIAYIGYLIFN